MRPMLLYAFLITILFKLVSLIANYFWMKHRRFQS